MTIGGGAIKTKLIKIGNSQGIRIPKVLIEQCGLSSEVELELIDSELRIRPASTVRVGWEDAFIKMSVRGDDQLLDEPIETEWDKTEWEW
ncbi:MAG: AbrB/MazE/SpoVT family DNA-binding domain-containing protein [Phormidesmis sp.]